MIHKGVNRNFGAVNAQIRPKLVLPIESRAFHVFAGEDRMSRVVDRVMGALVSLGLVSLALALLWRFTS
jgi:hypothetical protein